MPTPSLKKRRKVAARDGSHCKQCGIIAPCEDLTLDHIIPKVYGGNGDYLNLQLLCISCHRKKDSIPKARRSPSCLCGDRPKAHRWSKSKPNRHCGECECKSYKAAPASDLKGGPIGPEC